MKLFVSSIIAAIALGVGLWGLATIYDSDVVREGAYYHDQAPTGPAMPIYTKPLETCAEVEADIFKAAEALTACSAATQCRSVQVANLGHIRAINKSNLDKFNQLAERHAMHCGLSQYSAMQSATGDEWRQEMLCSNQKCEVEYILVETWEDRLYRESLEIIQSDNEPETL
jgi:hypothetical protein